MDRREFLLLGAAVAGGCALGGCGQVARRVASSSIPARDKPVLGSTGEARVLNRIGFGPNARDLELLRRGGLATFVDDQLRGDQPEDWALSAQLNSLDIHRLSSAEMADLGEDEALRQLRQAALLRAVYSPNQLLERMVDFWSNHFNVYARKLRGSLRKPEQEIEAIRKHALGRFGDLLGATARSPAMLAYLDNAANRKGVVNENYARELMELHTLGVHGGYTQDDVREVARCFTGWTIEDRFLRPRGRFRFDPERHDDGEKTVLGHRIPPGGGRRDGERVLEILAAHPGTARFIGSKLCVLFVGEADASLVEQAAQAFVKTQGDIRSVLRPILLSERLQRGPAIIKRPFDFVVSALRRLEAETDGGKALQRHLDALGQPLYDWPMPDGYPADAGAWTGSMLARWRFAQDLTAGRIPGTRIDLGRAGLHERSSGTAMELLLHRRPSAGARGIDALVSGQGEDFSTRELVAACLMSPEFQWR